MGRTVFTHAECIVSPDILDGKFHESCHADRGFHVVGEYEECAACGDKTTVEYNTVHYRSHRKLGHAAVEECSGEIAVSERMGLLEECIGLVRVGEVG